MIMNETYELRLHRYQLTAFQKLVPLGRGSSVLRHCMDKTVELLRNNPRAMSAVLTGEFDIVPRGD